MLTLTDTFAPGGPLSERIAGFMPRAEQVAMAVAVDDALATRRTLICEAGTGTGKTLAYLVPALRSGGRVIVSTGTKNLQEQLFHRDLPLARDAVAAPARLALLKGRANYLCIQRLRDHGAGGRHDTPALRADLARITEWAGRTRGGDIAELAEVGEGAAAWRLATSTADNCLGQDCPAYEECHVVAARRKALSADVLVVNHHLFLADLALRDVGFGELLPAADAIIIDEAHQLPELATRFFGSSVSSGQIAALSRDIVMALGAEAPEDAALAELALDVDRRTARLRAALGAPGRLPWADRPKGAEAALEGLLSTLDEAHTALAAAAARGARLEACHRRCADIVALLRALSGDPPPGHLQWLDIGRSHFIWHLSPLDVSESFCARMRAHPDAAWVFTSATLAVGSRLEHFRTRLGLEGARERVWDSPFDFDEQTLCLLPEGLPEPRSPGYVDALLDAVSPVLEASMGRAFVLFTSHASLARAAARMRVSEPYPLFVQGEAPRDELLRGFRATRGAVLLGTSSFWEGVDVRGDALSCVIIDKLPFAPPGDPLLEARYRAIRDDGLDPFMSYQVPQAVIALKQGIGRLIRDAGDRGVVVLGDPRLSGRSYGRMFMASIPPMPITRDVADVRRFFADDAGEP